MSKYIYTLTLISLLSLTACGKLWGGLTIFHSISSNIDHAFEWAVQLGQTAQSSYGLAVAADSAGNVFVYGFSTGNISSCNGVSGPCAGSSQGIQDYVLTKYSPTGTWLWSQQLGETGAFTLAAAVTVDTTGAVYVSGRTTGNMASCGGVSAVCAGSSQGVKDYFISKYTNAGAWVWTKQLGETGKSIFYNGLTSDTSNNIYVTGYTDGNLVACAGASGACGGASAQGTYDYFISKYTSAGVWQWTIQLGETGQQAFTTGIAADGAGNIYVSGYTDGNLVTCAGVSGACGGFSAQGQSDTFISKYTSAGVWLWTNQLGETGKSATAAGIALDIYGNIYSTGRTNGNLLSCSGVSASCIGNATGGLNQDYFILAYNNSGTWLWTQQLGSAVVPGGTYSKGVVSDSQGSIYVGGFTSSNLTSCNGVSAQCSGPPQGSYDFFISKYSLAGAWIWTRQLGETGKSTVLNGLTIDPYDEILAVGYSFGNLVSCGGVSANCLGNSQGNPNPDAFAIKY